MKTCTPSLITKNLSFTFFLLQLLLLSNENPGPDNKVGDLTVFHWNARSVRNKIEYFKWVYKNNFQDRWQGVH
jgi:hypothetical protein